MYIHWGGVQSVTVSPVSKRVASLEAGKSLRRRSTRLGSVLLKLMTSCVSDGQATTSLDEMVKGEVRQVTLCNCRRTGHSYKISDMTSQI